MEQNKQSENDVSRVERDIIYAVSSYIFWGKHREVKYRHQAYHGQTLDITFKLSTDIVPTEDFTRRSLQGVILLNCLGNYVLQALTLRLASRT